MIRKLRMLFISWKIIRHKRNTDRFWMKVLDGNLSTIQFRALSNYHNTQLAVLNAKFNYLKGLK